MKPSVFELDYMWRVDRPRLMENNRASLQGLWKRLVDEMGESEEEVMGAVLGHKDALQRLCYEMADVILLASEVIRYCSRDPEEVLREKISRNHCKRAAKYYTNGLSYDEADKIAVGEWKARRGDEEFFGPLR